MDTVCLGHRENYHVRDSFPKYLQAGWHWLPAHPDGAKTHVSLLPVSSSRYVVCGGVPISILIMYSTFSKFCSLAVGYLLRFERLPACLEIGMRIIPGPACLSVEIDAGAACTQAIRIEAADKAFVNFMAATRCKF
jgi:hypothetical protein